VDIILSSSILSPIPPSFFYWERKENERKMMENQKKIMENDENIKKIIKTKVKSWKTKKNDEK
jgi:cellulose biosynthesis protein BcsQ